MELEYNTFKQDSIYKHLQAILLSAILFYVCFIIIDLVDRSDNFNKTITYRLAAVTPIGLYYLILLKYKSTIQYYQYILIFLIIWVALFTMILISTGIVKNDVGVYGGITLILLFNFFFLRIRSALASISGFMISATYIIITYNLYNFESPDITLRAIYILICIHIFGSAMSYYVELAERNNFYLTRCLNKEKEDATLTNLILEERIAERTNQLNKNIKELRDAKQKAEESDNLKSAFLGTMSHELRTPLNAIIGFSELLSINSTPDKIESYAKHIQQGGLQLLSIIESIFMLTNIETDRLKIEAKQGCLNEFIDRLKSDVFMLQKSENKTGIDIFVKHGLPDEESYFMIDFHHLKVIMLQLISNAIKFTHEGYIEFGYGVKNKNTLEFFIKDTGIGINKQNIAVIFDLFRQLDDTKERMYQGAGLGLALVKRLLDKMDGNVWCESVEGVGSAFFFSIPLKKGEKKQLNLA